MMKRIAGGILILLLSLLLTGAAREKPMTLMVYMTGSDLESRGGAASKELKEMAASMPQKDSLTVLVMTGGASRWKTEEIGSRNSVWKLTRNGLEFLAYGPDASMGSPDTLSWFLRKGADSFPARNYGLILWDHGAGPLGGICFDERYRLDGISDSLNLEELSEALRNSPFSRKQLQFIGFDACLMATLEVADTIAPYAEYMIASQEPEPVSGWNYAFLSDLSGKTSLDAGRSIIRTYSESLSHVMLPASLSCVDLSKIEALQKEMESLFRDLGEDMSPTVYQRIARGRQMTKTMGASSAAEWDLVDLGDLADELEENMAADVSGLKLALSEAVCANDANEPYLNGLSIYFPFENKLDYTMPWGMRYRSFHMPDSYQAFLYRFTRCWLQESAASWRSGTPLRSEGTAQTVQVSIQLTDEERDDFAFARLVILEKAVDGEYRLIAVDDSPRQNGNLLSAAYKGTALYLLDEDERILAGPLSWSPAGEGISTFSLLEHSNYSSEPVYLLWAGDRESGYRLAEIETYQDAAGAYMKSALKLKKGDILRIGGYCRRFQEPGAETAFEDWPWGDMIAYSPVEIASENEASAWHLSFLPLYTSDERVAFFEITDLHQNTHLSEIIPIANPARLLLTEGTQTQTASEYQVVLKNVFLVTGAEPGLMIDYRVISQNERLESRLLSVSLNDTAQLLWTDPIDETLLSEREKSCQLILYSDELKRTRVGQADTLTLTCAFDREDGTTEIHRFPFGLSLDLGMLGESGEEACPLAEAEAEGLHFALMSLEPDFRGNWTGEMHIENRTGDPVSFDSFEASINGTQECPASIAISCGFPKTLAAGEDTWCLYRIHAHTDADDRQEEIEAVKSSSEIFRIAFEIQINDSKQTLSFDLRA